MTDTLDGAKLGTFQGVFVPTMCSTLGVVVFLRMGFVVGQAGFGLAAAMVLLGFTIAALTMHSLIHLLGGDGEDEVEEHELGDQRSGQRSPSGGLYQPLVDLARQPSESEEDQPQPAQNQLFAVLRSHLGANLGDTLGVVLFVAYVTSTAFYTLGFAEAARSQFEGVLSTHPWAEVQILPWNPAGSWISSAIGSAALLVLLPFVMAGTSVSVRLSMAILAMIAVQ
jgi:hypothetical protein